MPLDVDNYDCPVPDVPASSLTVDQLANRIREHGNSLNKHSAGGFKAMVMMGVDLLAASEKVLRREWTKWLDKEFNLHRLTARRFMTVAEWVRPIIENGNLDSVRIGPAAAYLLTSGKASDAARAKALELSTERDVTPQIAEGLISKYPKNPRPKRPEPVFPQPHPNDAGPASDNPEERERAYHESLAAGILRERIFVASLWKELDIDEAIRGMNVQDRPMASAQLTMIIAWLTEVQTRLDASMEEYCNAA